MTETVFNNRDCQGHDALLRIYQRMVGTTDDLMSYVDTDYCYRMVNPAYALFTKREIDTTIGLHVAQLVGETNFQCIVKPHLDRCFAGETVRYQAWFEWPENGDHYLDVLYSPHREADGPVVGAVVSARDMTAARYSELQRQATAERLAMATLATGMGIWEWDIRTDRLIYDERMYKLCRIPPGQDINFHALCDSHIHPEDRTELLAQLDRLTSGDNIQFTLEHRLLWPDGAVRHVETVARAHRDAQHHTLRVIGASRDVTHRARSLQELRDSEQRFRTLVNATPSGIYQTDAQGLYLFVNPAWCQMTGLTAPLALGNGWLQALHPDDREKVQQHWQHIVNEQATNGLEYRFVDAQTARETWVAQTVAPLQHDNGVVQGYIGITANITSQKMQEDALASARDAAEAANRAKSAFIANMSHELRTPLNAVLGYAQLLEQEMNLTPSQQRAVRAIKSGGHYLLLLINDTLDLAKIEAGRFDLVVGPCDLTSLVLGLTELFNLRAQQKGLGFQYRLGEQLPQSVDIDERRVRQVCMNLLSNAVKFTDRGSVTFTVDHALDRLLITVTDTGIGIAQESLPQLFEPFVQLANEAYNQQGSGLGLAISHGLVQQMGGTLQVESEYGAGSCFRCEIPAPATPIPHWTATQDAPITQIAGYRRTDGSDRPLRILIADDIPSNRGVLQAILEEFGFAVSQATDGAQAIELARTSRPDLVLMDIAMPNTNGLKATQCILQEQPELPIVAISAGAYTDDAAKSCGAGCRGHLHKPLKVEALLAILGECLPLVWVDGEQQHLSPPSSLVASEIHQAAIDALPPGLREALAGAIMHGNSDDIKTQLGQYTSIMTASHSG